MHMLFLLGAIILGIFGLKELHKSPKAKPLLLGAAGCFIIFLVVAISTSTTETKTTASDVKTDAKSPIVTAAASPPAPSKEDAGAEKKADEDKKAKAEADVKVKNEEAAKAKLEAEETQKKRLQDSVLEFENSVYALEATVKPIMDKYQNIMSNFGKGNNNLNTAYEAATNARKASQDLQLKFSNLPLPKDLPKDAEKLLTEAKSELSTGYYMKKNSFDSVLKYLDNQKPSDMQKFKEDTQSSRGHIIRGVSLIFQAKEKVGIEIKVP